MPTRSFLAMVVEVLESRALFDIRIRFFHFTVTRTSRSGRGDKRHYRVKGG